MLCTSKKNRKKTSQKNSRNISRRLVRLYNRRGKTGKTRIARKGGSIQGDKCLVTARPWWSEDLKKTIGNMSNQPKKKHEKSTFLTFIHPVIINQMSPLDPLCKSNVTVVSRFHPTWPLAVRAALIAQIAPLHALADPTMVGPCTRPVRSPLFVTELLKSPFWFTFGTFTGHK